MADNLIDVIPPNDSFVVVESKGFKKKILWTVNLTETQAEFICQEDGRTMIIPRDKAREQIKFVQMGLMFSESTLATVSGKLNLEFGKNKSMLVNWLPPLSVDDMKSDLRNMGIGMLIIGVLSLFLSQIFDSVWGVVLIVLGILNLVVKNRTMYIVNGVALIAVGLMNIIAVISSTNVFWVVFGVMQIGWGFAEIKKFKLVKV